MAEVLFSHSKIGSLSIDTGPNLISWSYGLNTANFPTYGGEVVQILSVFTEDISVEGEVRTYAKLEEIYAWFIDYIQIATQTGGFVAEPVQFTYPERGWHMSIIPKSLPEFRYGREVVAPAWKVTSAVHEDDPAVRAISLKDAEFKTLEGIEEFGRLTADIGYTEDNPFSGPFPGQDHFDPEKTKELFTQLGDSFSKLIPSYLGGDFDSLSADFGSYPAFLRKNAAEDTRKNESFQDKQKKAVKRK